MKKRSSISKKLYCPVMALLYLFAVCSNNLHAVNDSKPGDVPIAANDSQQSPQESKITYAQSTIDVAGFPKQQAAAKGGTIVLSDMGAKKSGYVLMGWHTRSMPVINRSLMETIVTAAPSYYKVGDKLNVTGDLTLYAVWTYDANLNGTPDYLEQGGRPKMQGFNPRSLMHDQSGNISFRSGDSDLWDYTFDMQAFHDSVYYVGCTYNEDSKNQLYESLISFNPEYCFNKTKVKPLIPMHFVIEYDGVLKDKSMIGGQAQKALDIIEITPAMVANGFLVDSLINYDPFKFNSIKEDGQGILKMYFVNPATKAHPTLTDWNINFFWPKPFKNPETGAPTDTLVIKFNIYNKPEFKTKQIDQQVDSLGYLNLELVSGTPLNYMMRKIDGFSWQPATAPFSKEEQAYIGDNVSILLREMDRVIGYQMFQREYYFSDRFNPVDHFGDFYDFKIEYVYAYNQSVLDTLTGVYFADVDMWYAMLSGSSIPTSPPTPGTPEADNYNMFLDAALQLAGGMGYIVYSPTTVMAIAEARSLADKDLLAQRKADGIFVPAPCREVIWLQFDIRDNVSYNANGATGTAPRDTVTYLNGANVTLKEKGNLAKTDFAFLGWNPSPASDVTTQAQEDALTLMKQPGETFTFTGKTTWYAVWGTDYNNNGIPDYKEKKTTYDPGMLDGLPIEQAFAKGSTVKLTDMGFNASYFVFMGWHTRMMPILNSLMMETIVKTSPTFYAVGDPLFITDNLTLYAVWAYDANQNGIPDYLEQGIKPHQNGAGTRSLMPDQNLSDNEIITDSRVWSYANTLHILSDKAVRANIYTLNGMLYKQLNLLAGMASEPLERGMYVVEIEGSRYKVVIK